MSERLPELTLALPDDVVETIVQRAAAVVIERLERESSPWLTRAQAATYLSLPVSRLEKDRAIPCHRDGRRVLYNRNELDAHFRGLTSTP
jgi:hypothetical protein